MIDFSDVQNKVTLLPESAFFLVFCSEAVFLLSKDDEFSEKETRFDACECLNRAMAHLMKMKRPAGPTHPFLAIFEELSSKILNSERPDPIFLQNFLFEAHDLAELVEI